MGTKFFGRDFTRAFHQKRKIAGCAWAGNAGNVFPATAGHRSRHASQHVCDEGAVMHAVMYNKRFPSKSVVGKTFPTLPAHAQTTIFEAHSDNLQSKKQERPGAIGNLTKMSL